jgi:glucosamine kinase
MSFFLAIDAGGTKTDYVLADETRELGRVRSGTIKRMRANAATTQSHLEGALAELTSLSGVSMRNVDCTCIGTAGESVPLVTDWLRSAFTSLVGGKLLLLGDVEIALDAAFRDGPGVLVLAGTGSNVAGRSSSGKLIGAGGWGPALADQGSGHRIGQQALRATFLAIDEGRFTKLLAAVMQFWDLASLETLVEFANRVPSPDFSTLTQIVVACAADGDVVAKGVLEHESRELAHLVSTVIRRLRSNEPQLLPRVAFAGSIMEKVSPVREGLIAALAAEFSGIETLAGVVDPVQGALWRARSLGLAG